MATITGAVRDRPAEEAPRLVLASWLWDNAWDDEAAAFRAFWAPVCDNVFEAEVSLEETFQHLEWHAKLLG